jgi:hypothetical protein
MDGILINGIILSSISIIISVAYFYISDGIENNVCIPRLTKASFKLDIYTILQLWVGYFVSCVIFFMIYYFLPRIINPNYSNCAVEMDLLVILGFFVVFLGRIVTKHHGVIQGRLFYSTLLSSAFLLLIINAFTTINYGGFQGLVKLPSDLLIEVHPFFGIFLIGSFFLSTAGEFILSISNSGKRSVVCIAEKLPSDFEVITGLQGCGRNRLVSHMIQEFSGKHHGIEDKLEDILTTKAIKEIRCFSKSLWIVERIKKTERDTKLDFRSVLKVIKVPDIIAMEKFAKRSYDRYPSLDSLHSKRYLEFEEDWDKYLHRKKILTEYEWMDYDIGDLIFFIIEYIEGDRNIMILTRDTSAMGSIIGAFSEEPYIIDLYDNMFKNIWKYRKALNNNSNS